ncbi:unnamed protein product [Rotaria sordida]|uniref:GTP cyclohydrolase II n=1 Tax=Rotaria sordida TaxID=392033 RepID=A0A819T802_9BILA|nr:unnamed protein product [Rotaria sordida]CAF4083709.1 unnamed protein product [Rotaria sordida]
MGICSINLFNGEKKELNKQHEHVKNIYSVRTIDQQQVRFEVETMMPTIHGIFRTRVYLDLAETPIQHIVMISTSCDYRSSSNLASYVRIHSECLTGEIFGSLKCDCGPQLNAALDKINEVGGLLIYLRGHEGRSIGLVNKLRAYKLQDKSGFDTVDANVALGFPADNRKYYAAAAILNDLGIVSIRLLTNNPDKVSQLEQYGIIVVERIPLIVGENQFNKFYFDTKRDRMNNILPKVKST